MSTKHFETFKGQRVYIRRPDGGAFAIPSAQMKLATGIQERIQTAVNREGIQVPVDQYITSEDPQLSVMYRAGQYQPEVMQFILGRVFETVSTSTSISFEEEAVVPSDGIYRFPAAAETDALGAGVDLAGPLVITTKNDLGVTIPLTKVNWDNDGFAANAILSFMANNTTRQVRFTNDLIGRTVVMVVSQSFQPTLRMAEAITTTFEIGALLINTSGRVWRFYAPAARPVLDGGEIDPAAEELTINFRLFTPPGRCSAFDLVYLNKVVRC